MARGIRSAYRLTAAAWIGGPGNAARGHAGEVGTVQRPRFPDPYPRPMSALLTHRGAWVTGRARRYGFR